MHAGGFAQAGATGRREDVDRVAERLLDELALRDEAQPEVRHRKVLAREPADDVGVERAAREDGGAQQRRLARETGEVDHADGVVRGELRRAEPVVGRPGGQVVGVVLFEIVEGVVDEAGDLVLVPEPDRRRDRVEGRVVQQKGAVCLWVSLTQLRYRETRATYLASIFGMYTRRICRKSSGESDTWTTGHSDSPDVDASCGCDKEHISLKTGECSARIPLKTRNSTSRAMRMMFPSSYQNSASRCLGGSFAITLLSIAIVLALFLVTRSGVYS